MRRRLSPVGFLVFILITLAGLLAAAPPLLAADNDFSGPVVTITSHTHGQVVHTRTIVLTGTATDAGQGGNGVTAVYANGLVSNATAVGNQTVTWSQTITLNPGPNYPSVYAYDGSVARNWRELPFTINFQPLDSAAPSIAITSHENGQIVDTPRITLQGTASDAGYGNNGISSVYLNGTLPGLSSTGGNPVTWSREVSLHPGTNYINVYAYDDSDVKNMRSQSVLIVFQPRDALPPIIRVTSHTTGQTVTSSTVTLEGTVTDAGRGDNGVSSVYIQGTLPHIVAQGAETVTWQRVIELRPGANQIGLYAYDASDVKNMASEFFTLNFQPADTLPPLLNVTSHEDGAVVRTSRVTLQGTATDAGRGGQGIASVYVRGTVPNSRASGDGMVYWSQEVDLVPGANTVFLYADDGNAFPNQASLTFTLHYQASDTLGPSIAITSHTDGMTLASSSIVLTGTASDAGRGDSGISSVYVRGKVNGAVGGGRETVTWSRELTLSPGRNAIEISALDGAEFPNQTTVTLVLHYAPTDNQGPALVITSHQEEQVVHSPVVTVEGTASDAGLGDNGISGVWINFKRLPQDTAAGGQTVFWSQTLPLHPGRNTIYITAADASEAPQETRISLTLIYEAEDELAPVITVEHPDTVHRTVTTPTLALSGTVTDAGRGGQGVAGVLVNGENTAGGVAQGAESAPWSHVITLQPGSNVISVVAADQSPRRNTAALTLTIIYDPQDSSGPLLTLTQPSSGLRVHQARLTVSGVASDAGQGNNGISSVTVNGTRAANDTATGQGTASWTHTLDLVPGTNAISVVARDDSPNQNATAQSITVHFSPADLTAPEITVTSHRSGQMVTSPIVRLEGTASDDGLGNSGIQAVTVNGLPVALTGQDPIFTWSHGITLQPGTNIISITARDASPASNLGTRTLTLIYEPADLTPPTLEIATHRNGQKVASPSILLSGSASDAARGESGIAAVTINQASVDTGGTSVAGDTAVWSHTLVLSPGANVIAIVARDGKGNAVTRTLTLIHDPGGLPGPADFCWARNGGGPGSDVAYAVAADASGNTFVTGSFEGTATLGAVTLNSAGQSDFFLAKYDPRGRLLWARQGGGPGADAGLALAVDPGGACHVTGYFTGTAHFAETELETAGVFDLFVARYGPDGILRWVVNTETSGGIYGSALTVGPERELYLTGSFYQAARLGEDELVTEGPYDAFVARLDSTGRFLWARSLGGEATDQGFGIAAPPGGGCFVTGSFEGEARLGDDAATHVAEGSRDLFLCRFDALGEILWTRTAGMHGITAPSALTLDRWGHCLVTGYFDEETVFEGRHFINSGFYDLFVAKYTGDGELVWANQGGTSHGINGTAIGTDCRGQVYLTGSFIGPVLLGSHQLENGAQPGIFVLKYDADGSVLWARQGGGETECVAFGLAVRPAGSCYVAGSMTGEARFGSHSLISGEAADMLLVKLPPDTSLPRPRLAIQPSRSGLEIRVHGDVDGLYRLERSLDLETWESVDIVPAEPADDDDPSEERVHLLERRGDRAGNGFFRASAE